MPWKATKGKYTGNYPDGMGSYSYGSCGVEVDGIQRDIKIGDKEYCVTVNVSGVCRFSHEAWGDYYDEEDVDIFVTCLESYTGFRETDITYDNPAYDKTVDSAFKKSELGQQVMEAVYKLDFGEELWEKADEED